MAIKPPSIGEVLQGFNGLLGDSGLKSEVDKSLHSLVQAALARLDMVSREEFDAQAEILGRTRSRVEELEKALEALAERGSTTRGQAEPGSE